MECSSKLNFYQLIAYGLVSEQYWKIVLALLAIFALPYTWVIGMLMLPCGGLWDVAKAVITLTVIAGAGIFRH